MKLIVLGANGRTGEHILETALDRKMDVTAVVRSADRFPRTCHQRLTVCVGDPCDPAFLAEMLREKDALVSALGGRRPTKSATSVYFRSAEAIATAASGTGLRRVLVTSTALLFPDQTPLGRLLRIAVGNVVRSATRMERTLARSGLDWTSARVGFLNDAADAAYRAEKDSLPTGGTSISRRALAAFLLDAIDRPETRRAAYGVSAAA